jgi:MarR-like DNA-binding transcriptional regulator SgrR of sgrS sRNA
MTLLDLPKGAAAVVVALGKLRAQGFEAAHYDTLAALLGHHVNHVKASVAKAQAAGVVITSVGGGRKKKSAVWLSKAGLALVAVPTSGRAGA